jgi:hypothetical protein
MMAGRRSGKATDLVFEGVLIPKRTQSAKIAAKGITNEEDLGRFLTAIFSDTLKGKIVLPKLDSPANASSMLDGVEQKLEKGLPVTFQSGEPKLKEKPESKVKRNTGQITGRDRPAKLAKLPRVSRGGTG